jgi:hypothetical protein
MKSNPAQRISHHMQMVTGVEGKTLVSKSFHKTEQNMSFCSKMVES